jgi:YHS domain-containing protein
MQKLHWIMVGLVLMAGPGHSQADEQRRNNFNVRKGVAIEGYDPVSYFDRHPSEGKPEVSYRYRGVTYYFASDQNRKRFAASPESYEPAYGGWCAYAMGETGEKVKIDPETYKILDGIIRFLPGIRMRAN